MSCGKINSDKRHTGSVVGGTQSSGVTIITQSDVDYNKACVSGSPTVDNETKQISLNSATVDSLNNYASNKDWNKWLLKQNNSSITFKVNNGKGFNLSSQLILLPDLSGPFFFGSKTAHTLNSSQQVR